MCSHHGLDHLAALIVSGITLGGRELHPGDSAAAHHGPVVGDASRETGCVSVCAERYIINVALVVQDYDTLGRAVDVHLVAI